MQVVYHLGAHCTDEDHLLRSLLKNRDLLNLHGIFVPGPGRYRKLIRQTIKSLDGQKPTQEALTALYNKMGIEKNTKRLILSSENFLTFVPWIFSNKKFYTDAKERAPAHASLFPGCEIEFHLGLRNPASFIPAVYARTKDMEFSNFMRRIPLQQIKWSDLVHVIRAVCPDAKLLVWCNEDTPLIWPRLLHHLTGLNAKIPLDGENDLLAEIMHPQGLKRFYKYLKSHPPKNEMQKIRIISAFLDKFAIEEKLEDELDTPGWDQQLVDRLTELYEEDLQDIMRIPGVDFIRP